MTSAGRNGTTQRDLDVELLLREFIGREPTENEWENVPFLRTLRRVERRLEMGGHHARIVAEALAAGAITVENA